VRIAAVVLVLTVHIASFSSRVQFTDVIESSGVNFRHTASKTIVKFLPETMGGGVAIFDADGDGKLDLYFTNGAALSEKTSSLNPPDKRESRFWNRLYRNVGGWKFEDITERAKVGGSRYDFGAAVADYDNDGDVDLHVTGFGGNTLYRNDGNGTFTDVTASAGASVAGWSSSAAFVDYDHDGRLDLFVGRYLAWKWESNIVCPSADGTGRAYCHPRHFPPVPNVLLHNNGDGTFSDASAASGIAAHSGKALGVAIHDFNRDGWIDIFVANDSMQQFLFRNTGRGTFDEVALQSGVAYDDDGRSFAGMGTDVEDYDNDGWPDVIVTTLSLERYALYRSNGNGRLEYASHSTGIGRATLQNAGWGTKFIDFDNDGRRDLFVAQSHVLDTVSRARQGYDYLQPPLMLRNDGASFMNVSASLGPAFARPAAGRGAAFADLDDDGGMDIVVANLDGAPTILRNDGGNANHWLSVKLRGTRSNRQGIGAVITVVDDRGRSQSGVCSTASSYQSASDSRAHFGLGEASSVRQIEVRWPSGVTQVMRGVGIDRLVEVVEPAS
jgi:hypothetical protein